MSMKSISTSSMYRSSSIPSRARLVVVATVVPAPSVTDPVRAAVHAVDSGVPVYAVTTMDQMVKESLRGAQFNLMLTGALAILAVVLAAAGVYAVMSYAVEQRIESSGYASRSVPSRQASCRWRWAALWLSAASARPSGSAISLMIGWMLGDALYLVQGGTAG